MRINFTRLIKELNDQDNIFKQTSIANWPAGETVKARNQPHVFISPDEKEPGFAELSHELLSMEIMDSFHMEQKQPFLVWGKPGVGKSAGIKNAAEQLAAEANKKLVFFHSIPTNREDADDGVSQEHILDDPSNFFVLIDVRTASLDPTSFMGLPVLDDDDYTTSPAEIVKNANPKQRKKLEILRTLKYRWAALATDPRTTGILFFDEINQTDKSVMKSLYGVTHVSDRFLFDRPLSKNILVVGAGNLQSHDEFAENEVLPGALQRRFCGGRGILVVYPEEWLKWAQQPTTVNLQSGKKRLPIHPLIIGFVSSDISKNFWDGNHNHELASHGEHDRNPDPDSITALSKQLYQIDENMFNELKHNKHNNQSPHKLYMQAAYAIVGQKWTTRFGEFIKTFGTYAPDTEEKELKKKGSFSVEEKWQRVAAIQYAINELMARDSELATPEGKTRMYEILQKLDTIAKTFTTYTLSDYKRGFEDTLEFKDVVQNFINTSHSTGTTTPFKIAVMKFRGEIEPTFNPKNGSSWESKNTSALQSFAVSTPYTMKTYIGQNEETNLPIVSHTELISYVKRSYDTKEPLLIYGGIGEGKSTSIRAFCIQKAKESNRILVQFSKLTEPEAKEIIYELMENPDKYFLLVDIRLVNISVGEFVGIPDFRRGQLQAYLKTKKLPWIFAVSRKGATGILFFDEVNQGDRRVLQALYPVIHSGDRFIPPDTRLSDGITVIAAGNLPSHDPTAEHPPLSKALTRRFKAGSVVLEVTADEWLAWAKQNNIHPIINTFIAKEPQPERLIRLANPKDENAPCTPDTLKHLSDAFHEVDKQVLKMPDGPAKSKYIEDVYTRKAALKIHTAWANEFAMFFNNWFKYSWAEIISNPERYAKPGGSSMSITDLYGRLVYMTNIMNNLVIKDPQLKIPEYRQEVINFLKLFVTMYKESRAMFLSTFKKLYEREQTRALLTLLDGLAASMGSTGKEYQDALMNAVAFVKKYDEGA